jgi:hypothetical protein
VFAASIIRAALIALTMEAARTTETPRNIPEDSHIQNLSVFSKLAFRTNN